MSYHNPNDDKNLGCLIGSLIGAVLAVIVTIVKAFIPERDIYRPVAADNPQQVGRMQNLWVSTGQDSSSFELPFVDLKRFTTPPEVLNENVLYVLTRSEPKVDFRFPHLVGEPACYTITLPKAPFAAATLPSLVLIEKLSKVCQSLSYEIVADGQSIVWQVVDYEGRYRKSQMVETIKTNLQGAIVTVSDPRDIPEREYPFQRQIITFGLRNDYAAPLPFLADLETNDPLMMLTNKMNLLRPDLDERVKYQLLVFVASWEANDRSDKRLREGLVRPSSGIYPEVDALSGFDKERMNTKLNGPHYHCFLAVTLESRDRRRMSDLSDIAQDVCQFELPRHNRVELKGTAPMRCAVESKDYDAHQWLGGILTGLVQANRDEWRQLLMVLSPKEMAALWHVPHDRFAASNIVWAAGNVPPEVLNDEPGRIILGETVPPGKAKTISMAPTDRIYHHYIAGKTGMGKSTLMHNLIHQDIAAGNAVAVLDPTGDLTNAILMHSIPDRRRKDVVLLRGSDTQAPIPLNPFRIPPGATRDSAFDFVYSAMRKIYEKIWLDGQMDTTLRNIISALLYDREATPLDIDRLFSNETYRNVLIKAMADQGEISCATIQIWKRFNVLRDPAKRELGRPINNRMSAFLGNRQV